MKVTRRGKVQWTRRVGGGPTANRLHAHLRSLWRWAIVKGYCDTTTFARSGLPTLRTRPEQPRARRVTRDEAERLLAACSSHLRCRHRRTGNRVPETRTVNPPVAAGSLDPERALPARREDEDETTAADSDFGGVVRDGRPTTAESSGADVRARRLRVGNAAGPRIRDIKTAWTNPCRRAGIRGLRFHDLRHEAASRKRGGRLSDARGVAVAWAYESHDDSAIPECRCRTTPCPQRPPRSLRVQRSSVSTIRVITDPGLLSRGSKGSSPSGRAILVCEIPRQR